jgi:tetratricopeptide (TPR) repeat protein
VSFDHPELRAASAYVVSAQGDKLILTSAKRPSVAALLRDSLEAGHSGAEVATLALNLRAAGRFADMDLSENSISALGTDRIGKKRFADGVAIHQLATTLYANSYRAFDRLGDAQRTAGDSAAAIASYRKSLELNPQATNAEREAAQATTRKIVGR